MGSAHMHRTVVVGAADTGQRLDKVLGSGIPELTRSRIQSLLRAGQVTLDGATVEEPGRRVKPGETYRVDVPEPEPAEPRAEPIPLSVVFEDAHLIVIDKPAGLVVHPGAGNRSGTLVNALIAHCGDSLSGIGGVRRPGIVHRLDKDTSGVMVVAKTDAAHRGLAGQFADHGREGRLSRVYQALVWGELRPPKGSVETLIGRHPVNRLKMAVVRRDGKPALTEYMVKSVLREKGRADAGPIASLVECTLKTGRTHQIRVHLSHLGHPVIGDALYGSGFRSKSRLLRAEAQSAIIFLNRQALHAAVLGFLHPISRKYLQFRSELPDDMRGVLDVLA